MAVTIKDLAKATGVSVGTVHRVLSNQGRFSQQTAQKVHAAAKKMGYVPNLHAVALQQSRQIHLSIVVPHKEQDGGYWALQHEGIERAIQRLQQFGVTCTLYNFDRYSIESTSEALLASMQDDSEGMLLAPVIPLELKGLLSTITKKVVCIDTDTDQIQSKITCVQQDTYKSGQLGGKLVDLLVEHTEPQSIIVVDPLGLSSHHQRRISGFVDYMKEHKPSSNIQIVKEYSSIWDQKQLPQALFVANSHVYDVAEYMENARPFSPHIPLVGYDLIPHKEFLIEQGKIDFIITQQPQEQGYLGLVSLYESIVLQLEVPQWIEMPIHIITKENVPPNREMQKE